MTQVFLALGSNLGDRVANLRLAVEELDGRGFIVEAMSKIYQSPSVESGGEGEFLNAVVRGTTALRALELLAVCQQIEELAGRPKPTSEGAKREGQRALDIDILTFGEEISCAPALQLPHPRALQRPFVLLPLLDLLDSRAVVATKLRW